MAKVVSERGDQQILTLAKGLIATGGGKTTFLNSVKSYLDANFSMFKDSNGEYTAPHINAAISYLIFKSK